MIVHRHPLEAVAVAAGNVKTLGLRTLVSDGHLHPYKLKDAMVGLYEEGRHARTGRATRQERSRFRRSHNRESRPAVKPDYPAAIQGSDDASLFCCANSERRPFIEHLVLPKYPAGW